MQANNNATWIWYPGDFEVWLGNIFNNRRTERGAMFPPFWKQDSHYPTVEFSTTVNLDHEEVITVASEGESNFALDGKLQFPSNSYVIPAGSHRLNLKVWNQATPPALFIEGDTIHTDSSWLVTYEDKLWIDENGVAHGSGIYVPAASWNFNDPAQPPSTYHLEREERQPVATEAMPAGGTLYDFGRETFGYLIVHQLVNTIRVYYGESREEALDREHCETLDVLTAPVCRDVAAASKAFRYVYIEKAADARYDAVSMDYEYNPSTVATSTTGVATVPAVSTSGIFRCSDDLLNRIWQVAAYTMDLTTREFFMDGIKRDRWTWSGDAIQSYLMNYYLRFDSECVKRTIRQLRGKDPVTAHINTIMDYTFYWFKSVLDYYQYTADAAFVREMWPRMVTLMDYVLSRTNAEGWAEGQPDDWIFVDWVDFPMHKRGTLCFEQILLCQALEVMATCARLVNGASSSVAGSASSCVGSASSPVAGSASPFSVCCDSVATPDYAALAAALRQRIEATFWDASRHAFLHAIEDGALTPQVTKFPNMFAILYGLATDDQRRDIMRHVMLNPAVDPITTPYMRFYELETLCLDGRHDEVLREIRDYWGGMLRCGATSFWEKYVPSERGTQHLAMYGRPYGKSLCHAWGASPIYLLGKYYLGVRPTEPGYRAYEVRPVLGDLEWMEGDVPTPRGSIHVRMDRQRVVVTSLCDGDGRLCVAGRQVPIPPRGSVTLAL